MFEPLTRYRHTNSRDIDIFIMHIIETTPEHTKARIKYWNKQYKVFQGNNDTVTIKTEDYSNWSKIDD